MNIYSMSNTQTIAAIELLRQEVGWSEIDLLLMVRARAGKYWRADLGTILKDIIKNDEINELFWHLVELAPFKIKLDNLDHSNGMVSIDCYSSILAQHDQSIDGCNWEFPDNGSFAHAITTDRPGLTKELEAEGYIVDDSEWCEPDQIRKMSEEIT